jgi:hypothetical protein
MGGQEGSRGYLFQAVIAALDTLNNEEWVTVCIEPNTTLDKIDILWTSEKKDKIVCQVKSSINNFDKSEILDWLNQLYSDNIKATEYRLTLIGNCSGPTKNFFNSFNKNTKEEIGSSFKDLYDIKDLIKVEIRTFDFDTMTSAINSKVHEFLSNRNITLDFQTIKLIANGLVSQFLRFSTNGADITKNEFEENILKWVQYNYSHYFNNIKNSINLKFYLSTVQDCTDDLINSYTFPDIINFEQNQDKVNKLKNLALEISSINLISSDLDEVIRGAQIFKLIENTREELSSSNRVKEIISKDEMDFVISNSKKLLGLDIATDFFDFGNLRIPQVRIVSNSSDFIDSNFFGSESEVSKRKSYQKFKDELYDYEDLHIFWKKIQSFRIIPIILQNNGNSNNEDIDINLHFPDSIKIVYPDKFPIPKRLNTLNELTTNNSILGFFFKHQKDSKVKEYYSQVIHKHYIPDFGFILSKEEKIKKEEEKFYDMIKEIFDYEVFYDIPNKTILNCNINDIKPNDLKALPAYILINTFEEFEIQYDINSKDLNERIVGKLNVKKGKE